MSLFQCYCCFAILFAVKSIYSHYLDICSIESATKENKELPKHNLLTGLNINNSVMVLLEQAFLFIIFKSISLMFFKLGW